MPDFCKPMTYTLVLSRNRTLPPAEYSMVRDLINERKLLTVDAKFLFFSLIQNKNQFIYVSVMQMPSNLFH